MRKIIIALLILTAPCFGYSQKSEKIFKQLESKEDKKTNLMNEQISRMMNIVEYKQKTQ